MTKIETSASEKATSKISEVLKYAEISLYCLLLSSTLVQIASYSNSLTAELCHALTSVSTYLPLSLFSRNYHTQCDGPIAGAFAYIFLLTDIYLLFVFGISVFARISKVESKYWIGLRLTSLPPSVILYAGGFILFGMLSPLNIGVARGYGPAFFANVFFHSIFFCAMWAGLRAYTVVVVGLIYGSLSRLGASK